MIFHENRLHENRLPADDSHEILSLFFFFFKLGKMLENLLSAAVVIGTLRVKVSFFLFIKGLRYLYM